MGRRSRGLDFKGTPEQIFLGSFRLFLEAQGTIVNVNDAPFDDFLGFYINHSESTPVAFVNRKISSRKAQLFTLAHEFGHILANAEGVSNPFIVKNSIERTCNKFAAEFLSPMAAFRFLRQISILMLCNDLTALIESRDLCKPPLHLLHGLPRHEDGARLIRSTPS